MQLMSNWLSFLGRATARLDDARAALDAAAHEARDDRNDQQYLEE
jgi:hypothetical protein